jgi:hypothetical protein
VGDLIHKFSITGKCKLIGSTQYRGQLFTSDYDVATTLKGRAETLANHFKRVIESIPTKSYYFMDFKAGLDERFVFDFEKDTLDVWLKNKLIPKALKEKIRSAKGEAQVKLIRDLFILRWQPEDITRGFVHLCDGKKYPLEEALEDDTIIKLDVVIPVGNGFAEVSENYHFKQHKDDVENIVKQLADDLEKYRWTHSMKSLKRLYSILELTNPNDARLRVLAEFFNSEAGLINKVTRDIELLLLLTEKHAIPFRKIEANVQMLKERLACTTLVSPRHVLGLNKLTVRNFRKVLEKMVAYLLSITNPLAKALLTKLQ